MKKRLILVLIAVVFLLVACSKDEDIPLDYKDFPHLDSWDDVDAIDHDGYWLIFYYHDMCPACTRIKEDVFDFIAGHATSVPVFFADAASISGTESYGLQYVPTMIIMAEGDAVEKRVGQAAILDLIDAFTNDAYQPSLAYETFPHLSDWSEIDDIDDEGLALIYYYAISCPACASLKNDVFYFASNESLGVQVYFVDAATIEGDAPFHLEYLPTMIVLDHGEYREMKIGNSAIINLFEAIIDGIYH